MTRNLRGLYSTFTHDKAEDWQFLQAWQPSWVRLMLQGVDVNRINRVHRTVPDASILLRFWHIDDDNLQAHQRMAENPIAEADRQAEWWAAAIDQIKDVPREQVYAGAINEPNTHTLGPQIRDYTARWLEKLHGYGIRGVGLFFSAGQPPLPGESLYGWDYFKPLEPLFQAGSHIVGLHEYMQPEGMYGVWTDDQGNERRDFGYLINRHTHCPMDVPIGIFEWGIDGLLFNRNAHPEFGNSGWGNFPELWTPERYADELAECVRVADPRVITICPFITDAPDRKWASFETEPAHRAMLARKGLYTRSDIDAPPPVDPPPIDPPPIPPKSDTGIIDPLILQAILQVESGSGFQNNQLVIRFEAHIFEREIKDPIFFNQRFRYGSPIWTGQQMERGRGWEEIHTGSQVTEWQALEIAKAYKLESAYRSISMGRAQIMGFNHARIGYPSAQAMFRAFSDTNIGLEAQIIGFINYFLFDPLLVKATREKDWRTIARLFNGSGAVDVYAPLLQAAYERLAS